MPNIILCNCGVYSREIIKMFLVSRVSWFVKTLSLEFFSDTLFSFTFTYFLAAAVVWVPQMISQPLSSSFLCSPLLSVTWRTPGLSSPWCCLHTFFVFSLVSSLVLSRLHYCNALLAGSPQVLLDKIQRVINCSAGLIYKSSKSARITLLLFDLHWLSISSRI